MASSNGSSKIVSSASSSGGGTAMGAGDSVSSVPTLTRLAPAREGVRLREDFDLDTPRSFSRSVRSKPETRLDVGAVGFAACSSMSMAESGSNAASFFSMEDRRLSLIFLRVEC